MGVIVVPDTYISYANMLFNIPLGIVSPNANMILHLGCVSSNSYMILHLSCVSLNTYMILHQNMFNIYKNIYQQTLLLRKASMW